MFLALFVIIFIFIVLAVRRRLRRPTSAAASAANKLKGDQETSASVNRFKVRTRDRVIPAVLTRKSSSSAVASKDDSSGYKVGLH